MFLAKPTAMSNTTSVFRKVPYMGVIYVVAEAAKRGFVNGDPDWCNLGQGQPEVGPLQDAPERIQIIPAQPIDHAYGPVGGVLMLREAVAAYYNRTFRVGRASKYTAENVAIAAGGRLALSRLLAALGDVRIGYQTPDYTAYEDMLAYHTHRLTPVHVPTHASHQFKVSSQRFSSVVREQRLRAYLVSNPNNPTGSLLQGVELDEYLETARATGCMVLMDEFYSHYVFEKNGTPRQRPVSIAEHIEDIEKDPAVIIDGLTKNFRYPGWRVGWIVGPKDIIEEVVRAASAIDGGPPTVVQRATVEVLSAGRAEQETAAVRAAFARKRQLLKTELTSLGVQFLQGSRGTFYLWGDISALPAPLCDADRFFERALEHRVMIVPGRFFDVNPGGHRPADPDYSKWARFSFGPSEDNVRLGLSRLRTLITSARI